MNTSVLDLSTANCATSCTPFAFDQTGITAAANTNAIDFPSYEHKKFSKRRRSSACSCGSISSNSCSGSGSGSEDDNSDIFCSLGNCRKYKYFAAIGAKGVAIYNSIDGTYEVIKEPNAMPPTSTAATEPVTAAEDSNEAQRLNPTQSAELANKTTKILDDTDNEYEYVKADFLANPLNHLLYVIRRTHRRCV